MTTPIWQVRGSLAEQYWNRGDFGIPVCDMHGHMGPHPAIYFKRANAPEMVEHLKRAGIRRLVFTHHDVLWGTMRNEQACAIAEKYPEVLRTYFGINPNFPEHIREDLKLFDKWSHVAIGLKFLPDYHGISILDKRNEEALEFANGRKLPVLVHTWGGSPNDGADTMLKAVQKYPEIRFFLAHCCYGEWEKAARCVKESAGNVWLELTAVPGDRGRIEKLVKLVGSKRILFGTDMPWFDEFQAIGGVVSARITEDEKLDILYRNAVSILGKNFIRN